ncbi:hypothetical protein OIU84_028208 [Salix udensis]|uniref:BHLH transcription factor n=1 Tax=Salix udensis TaxID=889485 RepID=A0AAD6P8Q8_9ROSI|nr:hypothetical protein OIU84_028208 [Salix udensis]
MDKEENYSASFAGLDYSLDDHLLQQQHHSELVKPRVGETSGDGDSNNGMAYYMLNNPHQNEPQMSSGFCTSASFDKLSFADVMQFADFGPKLALNQTKISEEEEIGIDPVNFLKFPVLNDKIEERSLMVPRLGGEDEERFTGVSSDEYREGMAGEDEEARISDNNSVQLQFLGEEDLQNKNSKPESKTNKRKRPRTIRTSEEVESQRMTHIAVERNRRKQMNEHLRVLRSFMPGSYVQRGDQASIIGGAIEFVRELEQLLQCLESQKQRRLMEDSTLAIQQSNPPFFPPMPLPNDQMKLVDFEADELREETAENKSCLADVEVKLLGFDAMIKILSRRRPGQLIKTIAALEDLQLNIHHTNITTIEQTVLYSFNVKIESESRFTAEDIASSVQQVFTFIHANSSM